MIGVVFIRTRKYLGRWENIKDVHRDMNLCLLDLVEFGDMYNTEVMPARWDKYIKEGFKNIFGSYLELTRALIYFGGQYYGFKSKNFKDLLIQASYRRIIPESSIYVLESLRNLRNQNAHGYDVPDFEDMYSLYLENRKVFEEIYEYCGKLKDKLN